MIPHPLYGVFPAGREVKINGMDGVGGCGGVGGCRGARMVERNGASYGAEGVEVGRSKGWR